MPENESMPGEEQERFEDYLELEHYIEEMQAGHVAHPPRDLTPAQARIYRMAALFRSASPEAAEPRPEFVEELHARLLSLDQARSEEPVEEETEKLPTVQTPAVPARAVASVEQERAREVDPPEQPAIPPARSTSQVRRARFVSRRSLLAGGAVAAASLVAGAGMGAAMEQAGKQNTPTTGQKAASSQAYASNMALVPADIPTQLHFVTTLSQLGEDAVRFATDSIVGYIIRSDGDDGVPAGEIVAFSASCTHMGCIVQWKSSDRQFHCPCHDGVFTEYGKPSTSGSLRYLAPLPRLETVVMDDKIYVKVPITGK